MDVPQPPVRSWRPDAFALITAQWAGPEPLTVLILASRDGIRAKGYEHQVDWETDARAAEAILVALAVLLASGCVAVPHTPVSTPPHSYSPPTARPAPDAGRP
ncbi:hypothetical protein [Streptomyces sp. cmx-4-7]|uniref:hypothetical protein n=1 Tax=Streptomyces sp. cmx-4-7 TaxID=2790939 RepID=UPI003981705E